MSVLPIPPAVEAVQLSSPSTSSLGANAARPPPSARTPRRRIFTEEDLAPWLRSSAYADLERTILRLTAAVQGQSNEVECWESPPTKAIVDFLRNARRRVKQVPLAQGPQRFGNKAFRQWLEETATANIPPDVVEAATPELSFHLLSSFGSPQRLDYGTGHELSFLSYLVCLCRLRVFTEADEQALVTRVFREYIDVCREVQKVFRLEPAGSKGVWGLDDHQHLVYLFGASQLVGHATLRPGSILSPADLAPHADHYLFLSSILHIHELKRGPFHEHSPLLHQIASTVPSWNKVTKGLWDMYKVEVLSKVPVVQHCRFGDVGMRWTDRDTGERLPSTGDGRADEGEDGDALRDLDDAPVITPAPWARTDRDAHASAGTGSEAVRLFGAPERLGGSTTVSTHYSSSAAHARRQHPTTFPVSPAMGATTRPTSFAPPPLFPPRGAGPTTQVRSSASAAATGSGSRGTGDASEATLAQQGGAAANSSPFGVLPPVSRGNGST
ncbi:Serine/threonine-protein phosphatase 2A activator 1 [Rhodotorula sphaerocarpa]